MEKGSGNVPRIVQVMYFKGAQRQVSQQPEVGLPQQWEAQWQEFLNTLQPARNLQLTDMAPWDDARAFLTAFEQVAEACQWPREEWVRQLLPALRGGMEQSFCRLSARDRTDYVKVKAAILRADALRLEVKRQRFRQCCYQELEGPRRVYSQLQDLCRQWLKPESHTKEQILEMIIQEQLLGMLPAEAQNWVRDRGPKDCIEMVALVEEFLSHRPVPRTCDWQVPVPETSVSSLEPEGRPKQHYHPGASEMTPTRNSALAQPSSAGLEMAQTGTTEAPVHVKEELELDPEPLHWEVMRGSGNNSSALEGLLVPTPEVNSQNEQPQATFQERPEHGGQVADALFGGRIIGEIKIETFQQALSEADDDFEPLREDDESSGITSLSLESSPLDPEKPLGVRRTGEKVVQKKKCPRRRKKTFSKTAKYYPPEKRHTCPECGHKSYYYSDLLRHMKSHAAKERFECLECGKTYRGRPRFENHQKIHLLRDDPNRRPKRGRPRNSGCQTKEKYICPTCGAVKNNQWALAEHMKVHTDEKTYQCPECGKWFKWQSNLSRHRRLHTSRRFSSRQLKRRGARESNQGQSNSTQEQKSPLELLGGLSPVSLIAVSDANRLRPRMSQEVELSQMYGLKTLKVMLKKLPGPQKGKRKGAPDGCGRRATELSKTVKRRTVHAGGCADCGTAFSRPPHLCQHERGTACRKKRPVSDSIFADEEIPCRGEEASRSICPLQQNIKLEDEAGAYPPRSDQLSPTVYQEGGPTANEASEHRNTRMHTCTKCGYQAEKLSDILKHFRVDNKEKPYRYLDCGNSFGWSSALMKQQQQMHIASQPTPVPNTVIAECDVTLSDDEELINFLAKKPSRHEAGVQNGPKRSSKRSPAAVPSRSAASRAEASLPVRSRERNTKGKPVPPRNESKKSRYDGMEKKHVCLDCGHRTYFLSDLVRHKRAHPNGKPFKCPDCGVIFAQPSFLKAHLQKHKAETRPRKKLKAPQGERKYTCSKCGHKTYKLSTHLLHLRGHAAERETSYICDECGKDFKRRSNFTRHKRIHSLNHDGFKIRRPSFTHDKEINRSYDEPPKRTTQAHLKKIGNRSAASAASSTAALRKHWRNYKREQRKKAIEKRRKMEERAKENTREKATKENVREAATKEDIGEKATKEDVGEKATKENIGEKEVKEETGEQETKEDNREKEKKERSTPELSLRARLERFAYSKNRGKEDSQEQRASDPKVSEEEPHHKCTECGKNFTYDGQLTDQQDPHSEAKPHRCYECRK